jgi:hypothetical protein
MRLSEWAARTSYRESMADRVMVAVHDGLALLGAAADPECWIVWGDDPAARWVILAIADTGLVQANVRVNVPGEGPRCAGKLIRWNRVQVGDLSVEIHGGHRMVTFQVESHALRGADSEADGVAAFADSVFTSIDGRFVVSPHHGPD